MGSSTTPALVLTAFAALGLVACSPRTPEERVQSVVERAELAAERRQAPRLRTLLHPEFRGEDQIDRDQLMTEITRYLLIHRDLHALTRTVAVESRSARRTRARVYVALTPKPLDSPEGIQGIQGIEGTGADILRVDLEIDQESDGDLRVIKALWEPATAKEMIQARPHLPPKS